MIFRFTLNKKRYKVRVKVIEGVFSKFFGLMFKKKSPPLLFLFKRKTLQSIHSFFCMPFIAIWFLEDKVIDFRVIEGWRINIKPRRKFNKLLEIPFSERLFKPLSTEIKKMKEKDLNTLAD